ncbi:MAG: TlyA family RNA methyltransferase [Clostridia bacterium]|nr:TlyA family RNA methyltransferase [Clostridia bacterium]
MRIDLFIFERGYAESRTEAKGFIVGGHVKVNGRTVTKPSFEVNESDVIEVDKSSKKYVSRGGFKLEAALGAFDVSPRGKRCIDVGASSGGFTDCLLQNGAESVTAVDSGSGQMAASLRADARVNCIENFNARYMSKDDFGEPFDMAVMDVSFISATYIIPALREVLSEEADFICLVKPQFEVGRSALGKGGIVKSQAARESALKKVVDFAKSVGFSAVDNIESPIKGGDGNTEYLVHFKAR